MLERTEDHQEIIDSVAALDIGKATLVCCTRLLGCRRQAGAGGDDVLHDDPLAAGDR